jgi:hypothetical protein
LRNKKFREELEEDHPSLDASVQKKPATPLQSPSGEAEVEAQLDALNARYVTLGEKARSALVAVGQEQQYSDPDVKVRLPFHLPSLCILRSQMLNWPEPRFFRVANARGLIRAFCRLCAERIWHHLKYV